MISKNPAWHQIAVEEVLKILASTSSGISSQEAQRRLTKHGPNELPRAAGRSPVGLFLGQFTDFMILVLMAAAGISAFIGDWKDTVAILAILLLNAVIGFVQEYRAERAMEALRAAASTTTTVLRDGKNAVIDASKVVTGDVVILEAGRILPADLRLFEVAQIKIDESALTGESVSAEKSSKTLSKETLPLGDRLNMAYRGTVVTHGRGKGVVVETGVATEFGKIAVSLKIAGTKTPLQKRLARFGKRLSAAALFVCAAVFITGVLRGEPPVLMLMTAISLAVAAIPEALPAVVTISLALGARKMVQKNALVRKLPAVETLGSVTYICADKTGTLTLNRMQVEKLVGKDKPELLRAMVLCNDSTTNTEGKTVGDPTETALVEAALKEGLKKKELEKEYPRAAEIPFDSDRKSMTTFHRKPGGGFVSYTKGAAEAVLGKTQQADPTTDEADSERMASGGLRVLAFAKREWTALPASLEAADVEKNLSFIGLAGILDPPREEARESVKICKKAGIVPVMITGDHPKTAETIAHRLGILEDGGRVMTGEELANTPLAELEAVVKDIRVYARVSPDQKLKIVTALQDRGEFVAMTGDGVNDSPALKKADIGVAMGVNGTDVAKESSAMILLDDNFATIVRAVREGRRIYDNMRRFIRYSVTTNCAEVGIIALAPFFGLPIPFLPIQILWINLLTDGLPGLALASEPAEKNVMERPPRAPGEGVFAQGLGFHVVWVGFLMTLLTLVTQALLIRQGVEHWRSMVFMVLCSTQLAHVLAIRSETESLFRQGLLSNKPLLVAVGATLFLQLSSLYVPFMNEIFKTQPLSLGELLVCLGLALVVFLAVEMEKRIKKLRDLSH